MSAKTIIKIADASADLSATSFERAEKNRCAKSCSIRAKSIGIKKVASRLEWLIATVLKSV